MPERVRAAIEAEQSRVHAEVQLRRAHRWDVCGQPWLDPRTHDRRRLQRRASWRGKTSDSREHRVRGSCGQPDLSGAQQLGDEERVAICLAVQLVRIDSSVRGELGHRRPAQRGNVQPPDRANRRQVTEQHGQRAGSHETVIAVGRQDQDPQRGDPPCKEPQQIQRRVIRPVHVFEHHQARRRGLGQRDQRRVEGPATVTVAYKVDDPFPERSRDVHQRAERPRRGQRLARTPERSDLGEDMRTELRCQRGLARTHLASYQHEPALTEGCFRQP